MRFRFYTEHVNARHNRSGSSVEPGSSVHTRGWNAGIRVSTIPGKNGTDLFNVYMTSGSNGAEGDKLIGTVRETPDGPVWSPA